jgi:hypothetical protein
MAMPSTIINLDDSDDDDELLNDINPVFNNAVKTERKTSPDSVGAVNFFADTPTSLARKTLAVASSGIVAAAKLTIKIQPLSDLRLYPTSNDRRRLEVYIQGGWDTVLPWNGGARRRSEPRP